MHQRSWAAFVRGHLPGPIYAISDKTLPFAKFSSDVIVISNMCGSVISPAKILDFPPKAIDGSSGNASIYRILIPSFRNVLRNASFNLPEAIH
eukprot:14867049-Heterocapsa_arctica.AAC.1